MLEREIISTCYSEEMYNECKFLEPKDFQNKNLRTLWEMLQHEKGDIVKVFNSIDSKTRTSVISEIQAASMGSSHTRVAQMALCLVEKRFKALFKRTLSELLGKVSNTSEKSLIMDCFKSVEKEDVFILSDHVLDYIGQHASTYTTERINAFLDYRNKRIDTIRQITNQ